jgi:hypothetical protein
MTETANDNWKERYVYLEAALNDALAVCSPDQYQHRQNKLLHMIADFLLEPYHEMLKEEKENSTIV